MTYSAFHYLVLTLQEVFAVSHFKRIGYKVSGKRMICTYDDQTGSANIFLTPEQQEKYCVNSPQYIYPVPNKWGEKGATTFEIEHHEIGQVEPAIMSAYRNVMNK